MISEHLESWLGLPTHPLSFDGLEEEMPDPSTVACRLFVDWESKGSFSELFGKFLQLPGVEKTTALIIGAFAGQDTDANGGTVVELLVNAHARLPNLRGIFFGDIISEEWEISWINQSDVSPIFAAFPRLEHFVVRGGNGLALGQIRHSSLKSLVVQAGGLQRSVLADVARSSLPALEHLELWLGDDNYGWDGTPADVQAMVTLGRFPNLKYLGLRNSEIQDGVVAATVGTTLVGQLETLDFSMGNITDSGAQALLVHPELKRLKKLDLHHHYISGPLQQKLKAAFPNVDLSDEQTADEYDGEVYRNISVSE